MNPIKILAHSYDYKSLNSNKTKTKITSSNSLLNIFVISKLSSSVRSFIVKIFLPFWRFDFEIPFSEGDIFSSNLPENSILNKLVFTTPLPPNYIFYFVRLYHKFFWEVCIFN